MTPVSTSLVATTDPNSPPDQKHAVCQAAPTNILRLLALLRWIIGYGRDLATSLQQHAEPDRLAGVVRRFRTTDLAHILARIARGLALASALEARLARRAARGRDIAPLPLRLRSLPSLHDGAKPGKPRLRCTNLIDRPPDRLPSAEAIAAELRRRPIGAVIVDICRDLGILPGHLKYAEWQELRDAITCYGGNLATLLFKETGEALRRRMAACLIGDDPAGPGSAAPHTPTPTMGTGPPAPPPGAFAT